MLCFPDFLNVLLLVLSYNNDSCITRNTEKNANPGAEIYMTTGSSLHTRTSHQILISHLLLVI